MIFINVMNESLRQTLRSRRWHERNLGRQRKWQKENPDKHNKWQKENPEKARACRRAWYRENKEKSLIYIHKRRARKAGNGGRFTIQQFIDLCVFYNNICLCCKLSKEELIIKGFRLVPDHVIPISKGGTSNIDNIQPLCHGPNGCNNHKSNKIKDYRNSVL